MDRTNYSTSDHQLSRKHTISPIHSSYHSQKKRRLEVSSHQEKIISTTKKTLKVNSKESILDKESKSDIVVSAPVIKEKTLKDKYYLCDKSTQTLNSSEISEVVSTSKRKGFRKSFKRLCQEISMNSLSQTRIDFVDLDMNSLNPYAISMEQKSWFSTKSIQMEKENLLTTSLQSVTSLWQERMVKEQLEIDVLEKKESKKTRLGKKKTINNNQSKRCKKVKIRLTSDQKNIIKRFLGAHRFVFNACVELEKHWDPWGNNGLDIKSFRDLLINKDAPFLESHPWLEDIPFEVKDDAIRDFIKAQDAVRARAKKDKKVPSYIGFKSRKAKTQSMMLRVRDLNGTNNNRFLHPFPKYMKGGGFLWTESFHFEDSMTRLIYEKGTKNYYLTVTSTVDDMRCETQTAPVVCALDPGVVIFQSTFNTNGIASFHGIEARKSLDYWYNRISSIQSSIESKNTKSKRKKRAMMYKKISNLIDTMHYETIKTLCDRNDIILLPEFATQQMLGNLRSAQRREMLTYKHYTFKQRLIHKAKIRGCKVFIIDEAYSTKTCFNCNHVNSPIQGRIFNCSNCGHRDHRDINPCKNMLKWYLTKLPTLGLRFQGSSRSSDLR